MCGLVALSLSLSHVAALLLLFSAEHSATALARRSFFFFFFGRPCCLVVPRGGVWCRSSVQWLPNCYLTRYKGDPALCLAHYDFFPLAIPFPSKKPYTTHLPSATRCKPTGFIQRLYFFFCRPRARFTLCTIACHCLVCPLIRRLAGSRQNYRVATFLFFLFPGSWNCRTAATILGFPDQTSHSPIRQSGDSSISPRFRFRITTVSKTSTSRCSHI